MHVAGLRVIGHAGTGLRRGRCHVLHALHAIAGVVVAILGIVRRVALIGFQMC